jgi:hypothetical protein
LRENKAMLRMCAELGFAIVTNSAEQYICDVKLEL